MIQSKLHSLLLYSFSYFYICNMRSILEYDDFRKYILDFYLEKKETQNLSWRAFAEKARIKSPTFLKLVCDGKSGLAEDTAMRVSEAMDLTSYEQDFFLLLVRFNQAKRDDMRNLVFADMMEIAKVHRVNVLGAGLYDYFANWVNAVIRELAPAIKNPSPEKIALASFPKITAESTRDSLSFLIKNGFLKKRGNRYRQTSKSLSTGRISIVAPSVRSFHRQMGELALNTLDKVPVTERNFSTLTLGLTEKSYQKILKELTHFRRKIIAIATNEDEVERVYELNLQLFPLTRKLNKRETRDAE